MSVIDQIREKARQRRCRIVLPEGEEPRTVAAAIQVRQLALAEPLLLGRPAVIRDIAAAAGMDPSGLQIMDPTASADAARYAAELFQLRRSKGITEEQAARLVLDPMYYGIMMVRLGEADGLVSGAVHTTGDMLRPALQLIKTRPGLKVVSSSFLMSGFPAISTGLPGKWTDTSERTARSTCRSSKSRTMRTSSFPSGSARGVNSRR